MRHINFSQNELNNLPLKKVDGFNQESFIFIYKKYIVKIFRRNLKDKKYTLDLLNRSHQIIEKELEEIVLPKFIVNVDGHFRGYAMKYYIGQTLSNVLNNDKLSFDIKINYLIKLGKLLEKLESVRNKYNELSNFYLNDLHSDNILITYDNKLKILDMDSCKIENNSYFPSFYLEQTHNCPLYKLDKYTCDNDRILTTYESELYIYIIMIVDFLCNLIGREGRELSRLNYNTYCYYINKLKACGCSQELIDIFLNIYSEEPNINPVNILKKGTQNFCR